jgi:hypothetical protein
MMRLWLREDGRIIIMKFLIAKGDIDFYEIAGDIDD